MIELEKHIVVIKSLCRTFHVAELASYEHTFTDPSNECLKGLLVRFDPIANETYPANYFAFKFALLELLGQDINLLEEQAIKNPFLKKIIDASKTILYGRQDEGMAV